MLNVILKASTALIIVCATTLPFHSLASTAVPKERIALILTGSHCQEAQQSVESALRQTNGVFSVDGLSVPGHLLIDVEGGKASTNEILRVAETSINISLSCQVEMMQSCITTPRRSVTDARVK